MPGMKTTDCSIVLLALLGPLLAAVVVAVATGGHGGGQATSSQNINFESSLPGEEKISFQPYISSIPLYSRQ